MFAKKTASEKAIRDDRGERGAHSLGGGLGEEKNTPTENEEAALEQGKSNGFRKKNPKWTNILISLTGEPSCGEQNTTNKKRLFAYRHTTRRYV